jgi:hypothetical protein
VGTLLVELRVLLLIDGKAVQATHQLVQLSVLLFSCSSLAAHDFVFELLHDVLGPVFGN